MEATVLHSSFFHHLPIFISPLKPNPNKKIPNKIKSSSPPPSDLRVCTNRSCSKQGSRSILTVLAAISPPSISVSSCGCLGHCGSGPNLVFPLPDGHVTIAACSTPARAARLVAEICGPGRFDPDLALRALALRNDAESRIEDGDFSAALLLLTQAIELRPSGGLQHIYRLRSVARLGLGDNEGALEDAEEACRISPSFPQAFISKGDAFMAMEQWDAAENAYLNALQIDPSIRRLRSFKARVAKLQEKLTISNTS